MLGFLWRASGHELTGPHYAVVVSDEASNRLSTVVVVPFSTGAGAIRGGSVYVSMAKSVWP